MKKLNRFLALLLIAVLVLISVGCNQTDETDAPDSGLTLSDEYLIVSDAVYRNNSKLVEAAEQLSAALDVVYGVTAKSIPDSGIAIDGQKVILLGQTKFSQTQELSADLGINDYAYSVISPELIVICGGSAAATLEGVKEFCRQELGYENGIATGEVKLAVDKKYVYNAQYPTDVPTQFNGIDISEFKIAYKTKAETELAEQLRYELGQYNGVSVPTVTYKELTGDEKGVICLGSVNRAGNRGVSQSYDGYRVSLDETKNGLTLGIAASDFENYTLAINEILGKVKVTRGAKTSISFKETSLVKYTYKLTEGISTKWTLDASKTVEKEYADGIVYKEYYYTGKNGNPYKANVLYVDTDIYSFYHGTPQERTAYPLGNQVLTGQMHAAADAGYNVVAGVNGDLWDSNGRPCGLVVKNGQVMSKGSESFGYFGVTKDGEIFIDSNGASADTSNLQMAIGGSHVIVKNGKPLTFSTEDSHCTTSHPRTLVGILDNGDVILVTVDGRAKNAGISSGATMENCADLMASLGAYEALSMDGGGSTTMAVKDGNDYVVKNNPCDNSGPRAVKNSLLVIKK